MNVLEGEVRNGSAHVGSLSVPAEVVVEPGANGSRVHLVIRAYDLKFWREDLGGIATVERVLTLGDRVKVEAMLDGAGRIFAQFPRRSSLLRGVEPGCRIAVEVTTARAYAKRVGA